MSSLHPPHRLGLVSSQTSYPAELASPRPRYRKRTVSLTSLSSAQSRITLDFPRAEPAVVTPHIRTHSAYGSFIPTPSARTSLDHLNRSSTQWHTPPFRSLPQRLRTHSRLWAEEDDSPLSSRTSSPTIPSFSRTASPGPILPPPMMSTATFHTLKEPHPGHVRTQSNELDPILANLERKSRLLTTRVSCATCNKVGSGYPKCGRCEAMWCSRECRMVGGKRHVCSSRTSKGK